SSSKGLREDRPPEQIALETAPATSVPKRGPEPVRSRLTHPERILWPERGVTKEGLAEFYAHATERILPHVSGRVLSLTRWPSGARTRLDAFGLKSFVKTSGGKGLHVVLPIQPSVGWDAAKKFTQSIADAMAKAQPERYVATMAKAARRGRIFVDYLRNGRGAT